MMSTVQVGAHSGVIAIFDQTSTKILTKAFSMFSLKQKKIFFSLNFQIINLIQIQNYLEALSWLKVRSLTLLHAVCDMRRSRIFSE